MKESFMEDLTFCAVSVPLLASVMLRIYSLNLTHRNSWFLLAKCFKNVEE